MLDSLSHLKKVRETDFLIGVELGKSGKGRIGWVEGVRGIAWLGGSAKGVEK